MGTNVTYNGSVYTVPAFGDTNWATSLDAYLIALASGSFVLSGGTLTLSADANLGSSFGLVLPYIKSSSANISTSGVARFANTDTIGWRNAANSGNLPLGVNATTNALQFNSTDLNAHPKVGVNATAGQSFTANVTAVVNFANTEFDTDTAWSSSNTFTVPSGKSGYYLISAAVTPNGAPIAGTLNALQVFKNGTLVKTLWRSAGAVPANTTLEGQCLLSLSAADTIQFKLTLTSTLSLTTTAAENYAFLTRVTT